jgi:DNA-binding transcriptional ArsR family regulator
MSDTLEPRDILGLLAEEDRLRVVAAVLLGAGDLAGIGAATGLSPRAVTRAVARLAAGGLVEGDDSTGYRLRTGAITEAGRRAAAEPRPDAEPDELPPGDPQQAAVLRRFLVGGRLVAIPAGHAKRRLVLDHLARLFEPGRYSPEPEVNQTLGAYHPDYASLRRHLVDEGFLERADQVYWRAGGTVELAAPETPA